MALTDTHAVSHGNIFSNIFAAIGRAFVHAAESNHRMQKIQYLTSLSDAELAARGIKREDIARHVFRDVFYV
ncbi:DUF1127 domain-containing protein [Pseudoprimorskyibacter insulae]|uniref:DUF1127 domain-containing protein n=1 Tax=Pseudoprimorskyibacter insulae TaxID=1695997 RepID=A0A2R8AUW3_9RHOB|nr:DUF1127 domain-containing protein [Pseudoprimorskyibacter insulae]SPF79811.1 hypothetical protein PRI8871_01609 [Pseudoprimorskyibacter insulae]